MEQKVKLTYLSDKPLVAKPSILCDKCIIRGLFLSCSPTHNFLFTLMPSTAAALHPPNCPFSFRILPSAASAFLWLHPFLRGGLYQGLKPLSTSTITLFSVVSLEGDPLLAVMSQIWVCLFPQYLKCFRRTSPFFWGGARGRVVILTFKAKNLYVATFINPQRSNTHK